MMVPSFAPGEEIPQGLGMGMGMGMGSVDDLPKNAGGFTLNCDNYAAWAFTPECWKYSPAAWTQIRNFNAPVVKIVPPAAVDLAWTNRPGYEGDAGDVQHQYVEDTDRVIADAAAASRAATLAANQENANLVPEPDPHDPTSWPSWVWLGLAGVGLFAFMKVR